MRNLHEMSYEDMLFEMNKVQSLVWEIKRFKDTVGADIAVTFDSKKGRGMVEVPITYRPALVRVLEVMAETELEEMQSKHAAVQDAISRAMKGDHRE